MHSQPTMIDASSMEAALRRIAGEIRAHHEDLSQVAVIGIHTRGYFLGMRLAEMLGVTSGSLDIALYRDDLNLRGVQPELKRTDIDFPIEDKHLVLVDDVLFTGRTIRAAMDALSDLGRPKSIQLAVLVDRGHRELPIQANFVGQRIETRRGQRVQVHVTEHDGEDRVFLEETGEEC